MEPALEPSSPERPSRVGRGLELLALTGFALTQPILSVFGNAPDVFIFRDATTADILLFALVITLGPPLVLWLVELIVGRFSARAATVVHVGLVGALVTVLAIQVLKKTVSIEGPVNLVLSLALGVLAVLLYLRVDIVGLFLRFASLAPLMFALLFAFSSPVSNLVFPDEVSTVKVPPAKDAPSVVMVVFDEWPTSTIVDDQGNVDAAQFPNLARLANMSTWYRNAPWVAFPGPAEVLGSVRFDWVTPASSVPASMPFLTVLGLVGIVALLRPRRASQLRALRAPVLGCIASGLVTVAFGFVAQRYLADFVPLLVLLALVGFFLFVSWATTRPRRAGARIAWIGVAGLAVLSVWFSTGLAFAWQEGLATPVIRADAFPELRSMGTVLVLGDCDGLYRSTGVQWREMELTPKTGRFHFRATFPDGAPARREPLVVSGKAGSGQYVFVEYRADHRVVFGYRSLERGPVHLGAPVRIEPGRPYDLDIVIDPNVAQVAVQLDGVPVLDFVPASLAIVRPVRDVTIGRNEIGAPVAPRFTGRLEPVTVPLELCPRYRRQAVDVNP